MVEINGKEYGLFYSVRAHCEYDDYVCEHPNVSMTRAIIQKALIMSKEYCGEHGGDPLKSADIMGLPNSEYMKLMKAVVEQEAKDSNIEIETEPTEKNAVSSVQ
ncbi:MAG: hypothetical protein IIZ29_06395 [Schwartzia sp.]|nr:hypothetical protein [Schwartzia sp. (in: firmicutes)]